MCRYKNQLQEQQEAGQGLDTFKHNKPDVNIMYYYEFGHKLMPKEA